MSTNAGLQFFPPPPSKKTPSRKPSARRHAIQPQSPPQSAVERARSPDILLDGRQSALSGRQSAMSGRASPPIQDHIAQMATEIPRSHTSFSDAPTLVRRNSIDTHSAIQKPTKAKTFPSNSNAHSPNKGEPVITSIFPRYNPDLSLEDQMYYPTQASPTHIPKAVISKSPYSPSLVERRDGMGSPMSASSMVRTFPRGVGEAPMMKQAATNEELQELWKVANGWRVSNSEGRSFCLKMTR